MEIIDDKNLNYFLRMYYIIYGESSTIPRKKIKKVKGCGKWEWYLHDARVYTRQTNEWPIVLRRIDRK